MGRNPFWAALDAVLVVRTEKDSSGHPEWSWKAYVPHGVPVHELLPVPVPLPEGDWDKERFRKERRKAARVLGHQAALTLASSFHFSRFMIVEEECRFRLPVIGSTARMLGQLLKGCRERTALFLSEPRLSPHTACSVAKGEKSILLRVTDMAASAAYVMDLSLCERILLSLPSDQRVWPWLRYYGSLEEWFARYLGRYGDLYALSPAFVSCGEGAPMPSLCKSLGHFNNARTKYTDLSYLVNPAVNSWRWLKNVNIFPAEKGLGETSGMRFAPASPDYRLRGMNVCMAGAAALRQSLK